MLSEQDLFVQARKTRAEVILYWSCGSMMIRIIHYSYNSATDSSLESKDSQPFWVVINNGLGWGTPDYQPNLVAAMKTLLYQIEEMEHIEL